MINQRRFANSLVTLALLAGGLYSQPLASSRQQALLMALGNNSKQMTAYQWKERIRVNRHGSTASTIIEEIRFDSAGQLQRIVLVRPPERRMGPIRARKVAEVKDEVSEVLHLAGRYVHPQQLRRVIERGEIWERDGVLRIQAGSVILPLDETTLWVSSSTNLAYRAEIKTRHDGEPVLINVEYQQQPNGPSTMSRMTVQIPKESVVVIVESYDFVRLAAARMEPAY